MPRDLSGREVARAMCANARESLRRRGDHCGCCDPKHCECNAYRVVIDLLLNAVEALAQDPEPAHEGA